MAMAMATGGRWRRWGMMAMRDDDAAARLMAVEERLAHLERALDDASAEIIRQDRLVGALALRLRRLEQRLAEGGAGGDDREPGGGAAPFIP